MKKRIVNKSRKLMERSAKKNASPPLDLTKIAIEKGIELSKKYDANKDIVTTSLYLAHTVFHPDKRNKHRKRHTALSAQLAVKYLKKWKVSEEEIEIIANAIEAHHGKIKVKSKEAEIMKNAECYKFVTVEGCLIYLHTLGLRGYEYQEAVKIVLEKMKEKFNILSLSDCIQEAKRNRKLILSIFTI